MPSFVDLREFIAELERRGDLVRIATEVDPYLEMTEIADRTLRGGGPALLFENPKGSDIPVLANLFGAERRVALGMGEERVEALREVGELLAYLRHGVPRQRDWRVRGYQTLWGFQKAMPDRYYVKTSY